MKKIALFFALPFIVPCFGMEKYPNKPQGHQSNHIAFLIALFDENFRPWRPQLGQPPKNNSAKYPIRAKL